jgi:hypothetical protein
LGDPKLDWMPLDVQNHSKPSQDKKGPWVNFKKRSALCLIGPVYDSYHNHGSLSRYCRNLDFAQKMVGSSFYIPNGN